MYYILFNPLSNGGTCIEKANELDVKFTNENKEHKCISLLDITNIQEFLDSLNQDDIIIIVGGDGTLYHIANEIHDFDIKNKIILLAKAGTGNDFYRDIKKEEKEGFVRIDQYITKSPSVEYNDKLVYFNNSCGIGVDGDICNRVNVSKKKSAIHYLFNCLKAVLKFKKFTLKVKIDGEEHEFKKTWFTAVMQGKYFGGGMKIAPSQDRNNDELTLVVVHKVCTFLLILILPTIYLGKHVIFKRYVKVFKCKEVELETSTPQFMELDGDIVPNVNKLKVKK